MEGIITQDGCWNCTFVKKGYDISFDDSSIYCNHDKDCPASYKNWALCHEDGKDLAEYDSEFNTLNEDFLMGRHQKLYLWEEGHRVESYKKCNYHRAKEL